MARRFNNTAKRSNHLTAEEKLERETTQLRALATSQFGEYCKNRFNVPEVEEAEKAFKEALQQILDPELRNTLDMATGKISYAYEILGFCAGHFAQDSRSRAAFFQAYQCEPQNPYCLRHSKAMHLLQANVNLIYIRDLLGHSEIKTTEIYARADTSLKRQALEKASLLNQQIQYPAWTDDDDLMSWLNSFGKC